MKLKELYQSMESTETYEYGCVMLYFNFFDLFKIQSLINIDDLYEIPNSTQFGFENNPHVTLLYGLHNTVKDSDVSDIILHQKFGMMELYNISTFEKDKFDVLKFDVRGDGLIDANRRFRTLPHTNTYKDYNPHLTIAYLQPNTGGYYTDLIKGFGLNTFYLKPTHCVYSKPNGQRIKLNIVTV